MNTNEIPTPRTDALRNNPKGLASDWIYDEYGQLEATHNALLVALDYNRQERDALKGEIEMLRQCNEQLAATEQSVRNEKNRLQCKVKQLGTQIDHLLQHCQDAECETCSKIICPHGDADHFHHDGCPSCVTFEQMREQNQQLKEALTLKSPEFEGSSAFVRLFQDHKNAAGFCEKHKPDGGARNCLVCGLEELHTAMSRIDYMLGRPNEMQVSDFDVHCNPDAVVKRVKDLVTSCSRFGHADDVGKT